MKIIFARSLLEISNEEVQRPAIEFVREVYGFDIPFMQIDATIASLLKEKMMPGISITELPTGDIQYELDDEGVILYLKFYGAVLRHLTPLVKPVKAFIAAIKPEVFELKKYFSRIR